MLGKKTTKITTISITQQKIYTVPFNLMYVHGSHQSYYTQRQDEENLKLGFHICDESLSIYRICISEPDYIRMHVISREIKISFSRVLCPCVRLIGRFGPKLSQRLRPIELWLESNMPKNNNI